MSVFANLEIEKAVQIGDKTRFGAEKSFVSKGATAINTMLLTPGVGVTDVVITDTVVANRHLDWIFEGWIFDVDASNNIIDLEISGVVAQAALTPGAYNEADLLVEIETQLVAEGLTGATVSIDADKKISIISSLSFKLLPQTGVARDKQILRHIGFKYDTGSTTSQVGQPLEYGLRKITLTVTNAAPDSDSSIVTKYLKVYSEFGDRLFCSDEDLRIYESDISNYVEAGRSSFKNVIRKSQELIVEYFSAKGMIDQDRNPLTKWSFPITNNLRDWSTYMSLKMIFDDLSKTPTDTYFQAAREFESMENISKQRFISVDFRGDGDAFKDQYAYPNTCNLFMR